jgi:ERCC4-type nuclease
MADEIQYIIQRDRKAVRADPKRLYVNATDSEAILMSLPGIGPSKVAILLSEYGTVYWALQALTDPSEKIPTITDDMKNRIREAFGLDDDMMITVVASSESLMSAQNSGENNG